MNKPAIGATIVIAAVAASALAPDASSPTHTQPAQLAALPVPSDAGRLSLALPERQPLGNERGVLFAAPPAPATSKQQAQLPASAGVSAPPVPYRFVGMVTRGSEVEYALAKSDVLVWVKEGETLDDYRVEAITPGTVTLLHLPLGERTTLVLATPPHQPSVASQPSTAPPDPSPLAADLGTPKLNTASSVEARPALRAAQLRGPRTAVQ
jgi:hypothetical protein